MIETVTLVLHFSGEPSPDEARRLGRYAERHRVEFVRPSEARTSALPAYDEALVSRFEARLEEAAMLAASLDEERALVLLDELERELTSHPELPQLAWLLAERHLTAARLHRRLPDGESRALALEEKARALEGERAPAFGEQLAPLGTAPSSRLAVADLEPGDVLEVDGVAGSRERTLVSGRHHLRVLRNQRLVWAGLVELSSGPSGPRTLGVPPVLPCSEDDFAGVTGGGRSPELPRRVRCPSWVSVQRGARGLELSRCSGNRCGVFEPLVEPERRPLPARQPGSLPEWAQIALIGAGTLGAGSLLLLATGAFEREEPPPTRVTVFGGIR